MFDEKAEVTAVAREGFVDKMGGLFDSFGMAVSVVGLGFLFLSFGGESNSIYGLATIALGSAQLFFAPTHN